MSVIASLLYYERIMFAEEEFLRRKFGDTYMEWAKKTPAVLPKFSNWRKPSLRFSFKSVLRREYSGFFAMVSMFSFFEFSSAIFTEGKIELSRRWALVFTASLLLYLTLLILKTKTKMLDTGKRQARG